MLSYWWAIYSVGYPISVAVHVGSSFQHYSHGVFSDPSCRYGQLNHAVLLVGYSKSVSQHYWIVKNSWGTGWGTSGYIHMKMERTAVVSLTWPCILSANSYYGHNVAGQSSPSSLGGRKRTLLQSLVIVVAPAPSCPHT